jgi:predicted ATPase/DNA-binding CsgD family transcriptional regulator
LELVDRSDSLPAQPTQLIGRTRELFALRQLLLREDVRLVTITGTPGIGKTRLAIATAANLEPYFPHGVVFVDLSTVFDPARVCAAIGKALGLTELSLESSLERVQQGVRDQSLLVVLDNFEQVLPAATELASLLAASPRLKFLVTSRALLRVRWERVFETPPLDLPDLADLPALDLLGQIGAVALFVDRAEAAGSELRLSLGNARAVAELCVRLDGLPLALELAATQTRLIAPEALLARMEHRLDLLANGARDQPERQRTLRQAIDWSYRLLPEPEQGVFRRLGVFVGSISVDAAQAIVANAPGEPDVLATLAALAEQNLLRRDFSQVQPHSQLPDGQPCFRMLETIAEYARERLAEAGELSLVQYKYAVYWRDLAEAAEAELRGPTQVAWLNRLEREWPNMNAALTWSDRADQIELGVRLTAALGWFWHLRGGDRGDGRTWLDRFASRAAAIPSAAAARARALSVAGFLAQYQLDLPAALTLQEAALEIGRQIQRPDIVAAALGRLAHLSVFRTEVDTGDEQAAESYAHYRQLADRWGMAFALGARGLIARNQGRAEDATAYLNESLSLFREQGDRWGIAHVMLGLGQLALHRGDDRLAEECWEERLRLCRQLDNQTGVAHTLDLLATVAGRHSDHARAAAQFEEALAIKRKIGDRQAIAWSLQGLGEVALAQSDTRTAFAHFRDSLVLRRELAEAPGLVAALVAFARLAAVLGRPRRAVRLAAAATALYAAIGPTRAAQRYTEGVLSTQLNPTYPELDRAQRRLGPVQRAAAWDEGSAMLPEQALAEALGIETELPALEKPAPTGLTRREREVAELLAQGCTNRQIAAALVITEGSAHVQVVRLLSKLGFHTRAQVAAWVVGKGDLLKQD